MPQIIEIHDLSAPELFPYTDTAELTLRSEHGLFIAESPKVIRTALEAGYEPVSLLMQKKYLNGQAKDIAERCGDIPVYTSEPEVLGKLTGYSLTQGVLCAMKRRALPDINEVTANAARIAVLEGIMNQTNMGAVFRSAAALGIDAVILAGSCSDPLFRRSVRVSMGSVFLIPWTYIPGGSPEYVNYLRSAGFACAAMTPHGDTRLDDPVLRAQKKLAIFIGTEDSGLKASTIEACDFAVTIPMHRGTDSLNAAAASAVAFWELSK